MEKKSEDINIKALALKLGLSAGSVSKALKDSHEISEETKKKVRELAVQLCYVPNPYASSLRTHKSKTIAVVIPEVADSFFSLAINGIEAVAQAKGYHVIISLTNEKLSKEQEIISQLKSGRVDGILISVSRETNDSAHIKDLQAKGIPVVFFDRVSEDIDTAKVTTNDEESGYLATKHLIEKGCKKISFLSLSKNLSITQNRLLGYKKALSDNYIRCQENYTVLCSTNAEENFASIGALLSSPNRPDGIIASVEMLCIIVYNVCRHLSLNIPGDIKIIGFSNLSCASVLNPSLTTITQPAYEMGQTAAALLCNVLKKGKGSLSEKVVISSLLHARESTGCSINDNTNV